MRLYVYMCVKRYLHHLWILHFLFLFFVVLVVRFFGGGGGVGREFFCCFFVFVQKETDLVGDGEATVRLRLLQTEKSNLKDTVCKYMYVCIMCIMYVCVHVECTLVCECKSRLAIYC